VSPLNEHGDMIAITAYYRRQAELVAEIQSLMPIVEAAKAYVDYDIEGESTLWPKANEKFEALKAAVEARKEQPCQS